MTTHPTSLRLSTDTLRQLDTLAEASNTSRAAIITKLVEDAFAHMTNTAAIAAGVLDDPDARRALEIAIERVLHPSKYC